MRRNPVGTQKIGSSLTLVGVVTLLFGIISVLVTVPLAAAEFSMTPLLFLQASSTAEVKGTETDSLKVYKVKDIVVTTTRTEKPGVDVPQMISVVSNSEIKEQRLYRSLPEVLRDIPSVMVQKTAYGHGSPYIRGFTGFRTLFLVDGIRLNNSVLRDGPNQYWNTVDPLMLRSLEVSRGPGSALYGTDAIGGVVQAILPRPSFRSPEYHIAPRLHYRYASAENSQVARLEIDGGVGRFGIVGGVSVKDFGDLHAGGSVGEMPKSGYDEWDADLLAEYRLSSRSQLLVGYQKSGQDNIWRTHKTIYGVSWSGTTVGSDRSYVYDQNRQLAYARYQRTYINRWLERVTTTISYQYQQEEQLRIRKQGNGERQGFDVGSLGINVESGSSFGTGKLTYGIDYYRDFVNSFREDFDTSGNIVGYAIQGPIGDDSEYETMDIFAQSEIPIEKRINCFLGFRYSHVAATADKVQHPNNPDSTMSINKSWDRVVGDLRIVYLVPHSPLRLFSGISQSYRAPNLSDLSRYDAARSNEMEVPSPDLEPEHYLSYELGLKSQTVRWRAEVAYFYTLIRDMIVRTPTGEIIGEEYVVTKRNSGHGHVHGIETSIRWYVVPQLAVFLSGSWQDGEVDTYPTAAPEKVREPIDRLMPVTFQGGMRWTDNNERLWIEGHISVVDKQDELSTRDQEDTQRIPPGGTPGYTVLTARTGYRIFKETTLTIALENMLDEDYRIHGSGQNEPGRNLVAGLTVSL